MVTFRGYLRIALRSRILGALLIAGAGLLVYLRVVEHLQGAGILLQVFRLPVLTPLVVLVQVFLSIRAAQMDEDLHVDELMASLPAAAAGSLTARVLAQYCAALLVYGLLFALGAFLFTALPGLPMTHAPLRTAALMGAVSLLPATALGFALGLLFRRGLPAYLTGLLVFVAGPVLAMYTGSGGRTPLTALDWPMLLSFPLASPTLFPDAGLVAYNRLFAVGLTLLCLGQAYGVSLRRRGERDWRLVGSLLGAGLLLAAAGVGASQAEWRGREAAYMAEVAYYTAPPHLTDVITPEVGRYDLDVSLQPASRSMQVEASVALVSADPYADFTLRHPLTVDRVIGPDGSAVPFARSGDFVRVYTEGRPGTYTFHYRGTVWQWRRTDQGQLALGAHVAEGSVILPANHGWYPLPGAWLLSVPAREPGGQVVWMQDRPVEHDPVPMTVKVTFGSAEVPVATNARDGQPVTAGWVIAQGYWSRAASSPGVMLSDLSAGDRTGVEGVRSAVNGYVARWFPSRGPLQWLEVSEAFALHATLYPQFPGAVMRTAPGGAGVGSALSNRLLLDRMHDLWLPDGRTREERALLAGVRLYLEEVFGAETGLPLRNLNRRARSGRTGGRGCAGSHLPAAARPAGRVGGRRVPAGRTSLAGAVCGRAAHRRGAGPGDGEGAAMRRFLLHARVLVDGSWLLPPALAAGWLLFVSLTGDPRTPASQRSTLFENVAEMIIPLTAGLWCAPIPCLDYQAGWAESRLAMDERPWLRLLEKAAVPAAALALFSLVLIGVAAPGGAPVAPGRFLLLAGPPALALSGTAVAGSSLARHTAGGLALGVGWWLSDWLTGGVIPQVYLFRLSRPSVTGGNPAVQTICLILLGLSLWALTLWLAARRERWLR